MAKGIAKRLANLNTESAFKVLAKASALEAQGMHVIHCEIGQPDFKTPENIIEAGYKAMKDGYTGYSPTLGYPILREVIADYENRFNHIQTNPNEVIVVPGGKPIMFYTMLMLVNPGDEVIYPDPGFPIYKSCIKFAGGIPVPIPLLPENNFTFDMEQLKKAITPKTKLVIINSPSNPTGGVFSQADIQAIADILKDHPNIYVMSDEIYNRLVYDGDAPSIATIPWMKDRTIILNGFSKTYAMTGWRLGYGIMHPSLIEQMELLMVNSNSCANSITQMAAVEALTGPQDSVAIMKKAFTERRDYLINALNEIPGVQCNMPRGAFYAFPDISSFGLSSRQFCDRFLEEAGVATSWGSSFGSHGEGHIRFSYATSMDNLKEAVARLRTFTETLS